MKPARCESHRLNMTVSHKSPGPIFQPVPWRAQIVFRMPLQCRPEREQVPRTDIGAETIRNKYDIEDQLVQQSRSTSN